MYRRGSISVKTAFDPEERRAGREVSARRTKGQTADMALVLIVVAIVVLVVIGWAVVGLAFKLVWWALLGLLIGALARLVLPGRQAIGWLLTAGVGIAGALLGGIIADALGIGAVLQFVVAVLVAAGLIAALAGRRRSYA
jgi:uncharacterized membrane protein YeaQ/YmgE (transglycosylase-associated protein family)